MSGWNPWHGCTKISPGCYHCYVYRRDAKYEIDASTVYKTSSFDLPVSKNRKGEYKLQPDGDFVYTCFTSDFLLEDADPWREEAWDMIRKRPDCHFLFITKRIERLEKALPSDWGDGWEHVTVMATCENQEMADFRAPILRGAPVKHRGFACEPLLGPIDLSAYLGPWLDVGVVAGGESGEFARPCQYEWVLSLREQCMAAGAPFTFKQTGAKFIKDGRLFYVRRRDQHVQAAKAGINFKPQHLK
jgi:protein gp37